MTGPHVHPSQDDPVVATLSERIGGPVGTRAGGGGSWWTPLRVLLAMAALVSALGMVQKAGCYADGWQSEDVRYSQMCYSDLPYLYTGRGMSELAWPYSEDPVVRQRFTVMEYPVGISYAAWAAGWATHLLTGSPDLAPRRAQEPGAVFSTEQGQREIRMFVALQAVGFAVLALLTTWLLAGVHRRRPWDAAAFALSPALALTGLVNWDLLALVPVAAALWAWSRDRPVLTGVMIGLGTAIKLYPLFLLGGVLVICLRQRRWRPLALSTAVAAATWLVVDAPAWLSGPEQWKVFWSFNSERGADLGSLWLVVQQASATTISPGTINDVSWAFFGLWCVGVAVLGLAAPSTPRLAQLAFLVVAGFLLVNKVYSPQYVLWLLPLAALARPRWRDQLVWQATEVFYFAAIWWYLGGVLAPAAGTDAVTYWVAIVLRMLGELWLVAVVARDVLRPAHDVVERDPETGPALAVRRPDPVPTG